MAISATTIATSIAALSVTGVTIKDLTGIPEAVYARDCPLLFPQPQPFMANLRLVRQSYGTGTYKKDVLYTLRYVYLHCQVGSGRGIYDIYQDAIGKITAVIDTVLANDVLSGAIDIVPQDVINVGQLTGPPHADDEDPPLYWGCELLFEVTEFED